MDRWGGRGGLLIELVRLIKEGDVGQRENAVHILATVIGLSRDGAELCLEQGALQGLVAILTSDPDHTVLGRTPFQRHFNAISTPFQRHFDAISTPFQRCFNAVL